MATSATQTKSDAAFPGDDVDIVILCPAEATSNPDMVFKVFKSRLALHSPVLEMLVKENGDKQETRDNLPVITLPETTPVLEVLVDAINNVPNAFSTKGQGLTWKQAIAVWEASNNYEMYTLRGYAQACLTQPLLQAAPVEEVLKLQVKARIAGDDRLADASLKRVAEETLPSQYMNLINAMSADDRLYLVCLCFGAALDSLEEQNNLIQKTFSGAVDEATAKAQKHIFATQGQKVQMARKMLKSMT